jgi:hypothetical protein
MRPAGGEGRIVQTLPSMEAAYEIVSQLCVSLIIFRFSVPNVDPDP